MMNWVYEGAGGTVVVHVSLTTDQGLSHVRRVFSSLTLPPIAGFLCVLRFSPVVTLDP